MLFALTLVGALSVHAADKPRVMTADALKKKGLKMEKTLDLDLDGDGKKELVVVGSGDKGLQLVLVGENEQGAVVQTFTVIPSGSLPVTVPSNVGRIVVYRLAAQLGGQVVTFSLAITIQCSI